MPKNIKPKLTNRGAAGLLNKVERDQEGNIINQPKLTNRGGAGLLNKKKSGSAGGNGEGSGGGSGKGREKKTEEQKALEKPAPINNIAEPLRKFLVDVGKLIPDPRNARDHPERNLEAIKGSLNLYGQVKPLVVRKATGVVVAGNGTLVAAKALGWTKIAAVYVEMSEADAIGYGIADNRSAELAKWNFETFAELDKILQECGHEMVGWSTDELEVLRAADFTPPEVSEGGYGGGGDGEKMKLVLTQDQKIVVDECLSLIREDLPEDGETEEPGYCIWLICSDWLKIRGVDPESLTQGGEESEESEEEEDE